MFFCDCAMPCINLPAIKIVSFHYKNGITKIIYKKVRCALTRYPYAHLVAVRQIWKSLEKLALVQTSLVK